MKYAYLILSLIIEAVAVWFAKEYTRAIQPVFVILIFIILGITLRVLSKHEYRELKNLSWGVLIGSIIHLIIGIGFIFYVLFLFRNIAD